MDEMTSVEFRKRYAKLTKPVTVTVLGRPIGRWIPGSFIGLGTYKPDFDNGEPAVPFTPRSVTPVTQRLFTPAPKPGKRG